MWVDLELRQVGQWPQLSAAESGVTLKRRTGCKIERGHELLDLNQMNILCGRRDCLSSVEISFGDDEAPEV